MNGNNNHEYNIGLVLSGGGARGFAHLGALKALNELGIFPDVISGTSAGAIVGALYADGHSPDEIMNFFSEKKFFKYLELMIPKKGLIRMTGIARIISENLKSKNFEDLAIPLFICATDFSNGKCVYFSQGDLYKKVIASATVPVLFPPVTIGDFDFVDGGIFDNFPVAPLIESCKHIIGININPLGFQTDFTSLMNVAERAFQLSFSASLHKKKVHCAVYLEPDELKKFKLLDVGKSKEIFRIGYEFAHKFFHKNSEKVGLFTCINPLTEP